MSISVVIDDDVFLPVFSHLNQDQEIDIDFLYGGRDSGKSRDEAQRLVEKCLSEDYFRYLLIKKTFNSIKESQWQTIKDVVDEWGLSNLFTFKTSPLEIHCINGNKFIARGCDDPGKLKSIQNPSGAWIEEGNQLTEDDWTILITTLRSNRGRIKVDMTFNPEAEGRYQDFWLYKTYFARKPEGKSFSAVKEFPTKNGIVKMRYRVTHATYSDNPHVTPQRIAFHEGLKESNPYWYQVFTKGLWGNREILRRFFFNYKKEKHVGKAQWNKNYPLYVSFDFNKDPICCIVFQFYGGKLYGLEAIKLANSDIETLCDVFLTRYPRSLYIICGDSSGWSRSALVKDDHNYYKAIMKKLAISRNNLWVHKNPLFEENQVTCNMIFHQIPIEMDEVGCADLIYDIETCEMTPDGKIKKEDRNDPSQQQDLGDCLRYLFNALIIRKMITI
jgi:phage terminase large subunit